MGGAELSSASSRFQNSGDKSEFRRSNVLTACSSMDRATAF